MTIFHILETLSTIVGFFTILCGAILLLERLNPLGRIEDYFQRKRDKSWNHD